MPLLMFFLLKTASMERCKSIKEKPVKVIMTHYSCFVCTFMTKYRRNKFTAEVN